MAAKAEGLLETSGWLPEPLRTPGRPFSAVSADTPPESAVEGANEVTTTPAEPTGEETAGEGGETAMGDSHPSGEDEPAEVEAPHAIAAE